MTSLVLLIGTNPLPNYVVAEYLLSKNEELINKIWLVHSEKRDVPTGTEEIAKRLEKVISQKYPNILFEYCALRDIGNAKSIATNVKETILNCTECDNIPLNYTGGTKAMSVHVYRAIEQSDKFQKKTFSYLDARGFVLKDDDKGVITNDLREEISISLEDLINLHGYKKKREEKNYYWLDALEEFKKMIKQSLLGNFLDWKKDTLRKLYYENDKFITKCADIRKKLTDEERSVPAEFLPLLQAIPKEHSILDEIGSSLWIPDAATTNKAYEDRVKPSVKEFLDGKWLENYVLMILKEKTSHKTIPIECNWKLMKQDGGKNFELDVIVLNGYQVCGISCTTDTTEGLCKEKGFEVLHRVNQIGGEEAKAVLITCLVQDKVERLEDDLRYETGGENKLIVLGIEDLKEEILWEKIRKHIWGGN
ncbi:MAG: hypothetical protein KKE44_26315 [Proteobacteria bacterium]|nr:hypothetical protein [bacterium]MBU1586246.1 hypothetical protein [Pseudomonadota bacterium]